MCCRAARAQSSGSLVSFPVSAALATLQSYRCSRVVMWRYEGIDGERPALGNGVQCVKAGDDVLRSNSAGRKEVLRW